MSSFPGSYEDNQAESAGHCHHGYPTGSCEACRAETTRHPDDCTCQDCTARFDAVMWGWLTPARVAIADRERRSGEIPVA